MEEKQDYSDGGSAWEWGYNASIRMLVKIQAIVHAYYTDSRQTPISAQSALAGIAEVLGMEVTK
jgi:hypothetical protein